MRGPHYTQPIYIQYNDTQHNYIQYNDTLHNDIHQNNNKNETLSTIVDSCYAECYLCRVSLMLSVANKAFMLSLVLLYVVSWASASKASRLPTAWVI